MKRGKFEYNFPLFIYYLMLLIFTLRNQIRESPCLPCNPIYPFVGSSANGLGNQLGISLPSGLTVPEVHLLMSISVTFLPFRITLMRCPTHLMRIWFHSPGFLHPGGRKWLRTFHKVCRFPIFHNDRQQSVFLQNWESNL